jgi:O-antigen/teichoic acid export membrane protein
VCDEPYRRARQRQAAQEAPGTNPSARTRNYIRQIKGAFAFKALGALASFAAVPLMLRYLGAERYGIWSTAMSITAWVMLSDMGIGYGLRNKVTEALARNDIADAGAYIASAYTALGMLALAAFALFVPASAHVAWQRLFNTSGVDDATLRSFALLTIFFILASMWSGLVNQVLNALQRSSAVVFGQMVFNALCLAFVFVLLHTASPSLVLMATAYGVALFAANAGLSIWCYRQRLALAPRAGIDRTRLAALMRLGLQFFGLELGYVVTVTTDKILITQLFGPQSVAQYDVLLKLFSVVTVAHGLITMPLWSSYADAYHQHDHAWIHATLRGQRLVFVAFAFGIILLALVARPVLAWWIGAAIPVPLGLVAGMAAFIAIFTWNNIHSTVLNSIGVTGPQLRLSLLAMAVNVPLSIAAVRVGGFGAEAIPLASAISLLPFALRCHCHLRAALRAPV